MTRAVTTIDETRTGRMSRRAVLTGAVALGLGGTMAARAAEADLPWTMPPVKRLDVGGQSIAYFEQGSGPPLILVHGMSGSPPLEWGRVMSRLAQDFRVVAPYQIGFAPSSQPDLSYDAATFAGYLSAFMEALAIDRPIMVGESFGGWVVGHYALLQGDASVLGGRIAPISRLVIVDGALRVDGPPQTGPNAPRSINDPAIGARAFREMGGGPPADNSLVSGRVVGASIPNQPLTPERLARITTPTLVIWGGDDELFSVDRGRQYAKEISGAQFVAIPGSGHIPSVERPQAFLEALLAFAHPPAKR